MDTYIPSNVIVHETSVFFESRNVAAPIHIVQYDDQLPIVAVSLFKGDNGSEEYVLPSGAIANLRYVRPDGGVAYNAALGKSADSKIVYFEVTQVMAMYFGRARAVVEIDISGKVACSSPITFEIDRNPVQEGQIEATDEFTAVTQYAEMAREAAESISGMTADAEASVPGSDASVTVSGGTGPSDPYHLHFVLPRGEAGPSGNAAVIAPEYSTSSAYNVGDIVIQNNLLYICTTPIPSGETWNSSHWQLTTMGEQMERKANTDGSYVTLRSGSSDTADQLYSNTYITDDEPYIFRTSGGSADIADRESLELEGNTVGWNQLFPNGDFHEASGYSLNRCTMAVSNNIGEFTCNSTAYATFGFYRSMSYIPGHKYFVCGTAKCATTNGAQALTINASSSALQVVRNTLSNPTENVWYYLYAFISAIGESSVGTSCSASYAANKIALGDKIYTKNFMFIDLTLLYGSDIADKIYALEQATSGAGVAWLIKRFPKLDGGYYAYHAPSLESVCVDRHVMNRFNQWDEEWDNCYYNKGVKTASASNVGSNTLIPCIPSTTYYFETQGYDMYVTLYDANGNYIDYPYPGGNSAFGAKVNNSTYTTFANAHFMTFNLAGSYGTSYKHDICINLHWDGERDGEYEAHEEFSYAMGHDELRGIPEAEMVTPEGGSTPVWTGNLVYNGDVKTPDGKIRRKWGYLDLGAVTWNKVIGDFGKFYTVLSDALDGYAKIMMPKYDPSDSSSQTTLEDKTYKYFQNNNKRFFIRDDTYINSTKDQFATAMSGIYLLYELATPTIEDADSYMDPQNVDNWGTERFVDYHVEQGDRDVEIFVGHTTKYPPDLKAKLEMVPTNPADDGVYVLKMEDGEGGYIPGVDASPLIINGTWTAAEGGTTDKTFAEITATFGTNKNVYVHLPATAVTPEVLIQLNTKVFGDDVTFIGNLIGHDLSLNVLVVYVITVVNNNGSAIFNIDAINVPVS